MIYNVKDLKSILMIASIYLGANTIVQQKANAYYYHVNLYQLLNKRKNHGTQNNSKIHLLNIGKKIKVLKVNYLWLVEFYKSFMTTNGD